MLALALAATIALRPDAAPLSPALAAKMRPDVLAGAILAPGHPPIARVRVSPFGQVPPPPPQMPTITQIRLYTVGVKSGRRRFCENQVITVTLAPVMRSDRFLPPSPPSELAARKGYSWQGPDESIPCESRQRSFFDPGLVYDDRAFEIIDRFSRLQERTRMGRALTVTLSVEDQEAVRLQAFAARNTDPIVEPTAEELTPITDGRRALSLFPTHQIESISASTPPWSALTPVDAGSEHIAVDVDSVALFAGGEWHATLVLRGKTITHVHLLRRVPPPF